MSTFTNHAVPPAITEAGFQQLSAELEQLRTVGRTEVAEYVREAREDGDLPDNPALLDALEQQAQLEHRIAVLSQYLASAQVTQTDDGTAGVGSEVALRDLDTGEELRFELVGEFESDADDDRVSVESPIGAAINGLRAGTVASVLTPRGMRRLELLEVMAAPMTRSASR